MSRTKNPTARSTLSRMSCSLSALLALTLLITPTQSSVHPVSTIRASSTALGQAVTSSTLVWETYDARDSNQMQYAVEGGKFISEDEHYPIYVCRVTFDGMPTTGHTEKKQQKHVCITALYKYTVSEHFDLLMNKGHLGKIAWKPWNKYEAAMPYGSIRVAEDTYIGRHRAEHELNAEGVEVRNGADYNVGRYDRVGLGKIKVVVNEVEHVYDRGEILVETEPYRYELRDIKLDRGRMDRRENKTELASGTLENRGDNYETVEKVLSYRFNYVQYWGSHDGVARGLPTKIFENNVQNPANISWALKHSEIRNENKAVYSKLYPGTAINVTLRGNYVTLEAPYSAKLYAFFEGSDSVSRDINAEVRKNYLKDVKLEFSPVYWIENGTMVPTTTTTSTTSTTTHATTTSTSTHEPTPINEPPVVHVEHRGVQHSGPDTLENEANELTNEVSSHNAPENMSSKDAALAGFGLSSKSAGSIVTGATFMLLLLALFNL